MPLAHVPALLLSLNVYRSVLEGPFYPVGGPSAIADAMFSELEHTGGKSLTRCHLCIEIFVIVV